MATPYPRTLRALGADGHRGAVLGWAVAGALLLGWLGWFFGARVSVIEASRSARLEADAAAHPVAAPQSGALVRSLLVLGKPVHAGELLAELDDRGAVLQRNEQRSRLQSLPARRAALQAESDALRGARQRDEAAAAAALQAAQARIADAAAQLALAADLERRLAAEAPGNVAEVDGLRARADTARLRAQHEALAAEGRRLRLDAEARAGDAQARIAALDGQRAALDGEAATLAAGVARLDAEIERLRVRAPVDGTLAEVAALQPGAFVAEGQHVATVLPTGRLRLVAEFEPATALGRLQAGQAARLRLDGFPWTEHGSLRARVRVVAGEVRDQRLRAELVLEDDAALPGVVLQHGLGGRVEVALEDVSPARLLLRAIGGRLAGGAAESAR